MATLAELFVIFKGDDKQLSGDLDTAKGKVSGFASNATALIGGAVAGAAVAAGAAIVGIGTAAMNVSSDTATAAADISASLGIPIEKANEFAEVAKRVYGNNFAESVGDAATAVEALAKQLGFTADDPALQDMAENAFRLRDVFGVDVNDSISAVKTLVENFGISSGQAFDMIAAGYQKGLDRSGDFLDTINEYSTQFDNGGASVEEFFALMESGAAGGMLGVDKAADAFKEFRLRISDGSDLTAASLASIGLNVDEIMAGMSDGSIEASDAFMMVQEALKNTDDPVTRMNAGIGLMGSQFEDLGDWVGTNMTMIGEWGTTSVGAIDSLNTKYETFGGAVEGIWRRLVVSISPFTDKLLEMVNNSMPAVMGAFDAFDANVGPIIEGIGGALTNMLNFVTPLFGSLGASVEGASGPLQYLKDWVDTNLPLVQTIFQNVLGAIKGFWDLFGEDIKTVVNNTFETIKTIIGTVLATIGDTITLALQLLAGDWDGAWETFKTIFERIWETIKTVVGNQLDSLKALFTAIDWGKVGETLINAVKGGIEAVWSGVSGFVSTSIENLRTSFTNIDWNAVGTAIINGVKGGIEAVWSALSGYVSTSLETLRTSFTSIDWGAVGNAIIDAVRTGIENTWNTVTTSVSTLIESFKTKFTEIDWGELGKAIIEGIANGITNAVSKITTAAKNAAQDAYEAAKDWLGISSPSKKTEKEIGVPFAEGIGKGIEKSMRGLTGDVNLGLSGLMSGIQAQPAMAGAGGTTINVYLTGDNATYEGGRAVGRGILDEMRRRGA